MGQELKGEQETIWQSRKENLIDESRESEGGERDVAKRGERVGGTDHAQFSGPNQLIKSWKQQGTRGKSQVLCVYVG